MCILVTSQNWAWKMKRSKSNSREKNLANLDRFSKEYNEQQPEAESVRIVCPTGVDVWNRNVSTKKTIREQSQSGTENNRT